MCESRIIGTKPHFYGTEVKTLKRKDCPLPSRFCEIGCCVYEMSCHILHEINPYLYSFVKEKIQLCHISYQRETF